MHLRLTCPKCGGIMGSCEDGFSCLNCGFIQYTQIGSTEIVRSGSFGPREFNLSDKMQFPPLGHLPVGVYKLLRTKSVTEMCL